MTRHEGLRLLAVAGSLREASSNLVLLEAASSMAPAGVHIELFRGIGDLPHFNADLDADGLLPTAALAWRDLVAGCAGMIISCPEYAGGIPGTFKNALDWLVGDARFQGKPILILNASPRSVSAQQALRLVLRTMSADIVEEASLTLPLLGTRSTAGDIRASGESAARMATSLQIFADHVLAADHTL
ncbi:NAD(P)H-dependent oxidoreductase [Sphingomonas sp. So64.6b]|uniref:NADPH-dependent FMN reductase n=1 Tax=Sphingomonas sp. So64.6b TaxID=2997354 RepID=UPI0015FEF5EC|nr:NADPH-dependent FMN reductase [Sphingomonas sp. So64.6b]QNA85442.1 NAD(P)H-dependent oxidoreductase [Sphingomonas sp. So64.6b]